MRPGAATTGAPVASARTGIRVSPFTPVTVTTAGAESNPWTRQDRQDGEGSDHRRPRMDTARATSRSIDFALERFALVVLLLSLTQRQRDLRPALLEVELQRNQGETTLLDRTDHLLDFSAMEQQLPGTHGIVVVAVALFVWRDVHSFEKDLPVLHPGIRLLDGGFAISQGLDLGPGQHDTRLPGLEDVVIVRRLGVAGDRMLPLGGRGELAVHSGFPKQRIGHHFGWVNGSSDRRGHEEAEGTERCHTVPKAGLEPARACAHCALNAARLPVPPLRRQGEERAGERGLPSFRVLPTSQYRATPSPPAPPTRRSRRPDSGPFRIPRP